MIVVLDDVQIGILVGHRLWRLCALFLELLLLGLDVVAVDAYGSLLAESLHFFHVGVLVFDLLELLLDELCFLMILVVVNL